MFAVVIYNGRFLTLIFVLIEPGPLCAWTPEDVADLVGEQSSLAFSSTEKHVPGGSSPLGSTEGFRRRVFCPWACRSSSPYIDTTDGWIVLH